MNYAAFIAELRKKTHPKHVYLLAGEERYYIEKAKQHLLELLFPNGEGIRDGLEEVSGDMETDALSGLIESVPFLVPKHVVVVKESPLFYAKKGADKDSDSAKRRENGSEDGSAPKRNNIKRNDLLLKTLTNMPNYAYVIFLCAGSVDKRGKAYKTVKEIGFVLEAAPIRPWNIGDWLTNRLAEIQREFNTEAYAYFMGAVGMMHEVSLAYLDKEFEKLALYTDTRIINKEKLIAVLAGVPEVSSFAMIDAINEKDATKALSILHRQIADGTYPPVLLALLIRHVRQLWQTKLFIAQGISNKQLGLAMKISPFIAAKLGRVSGAFSERKLKKVLLNLIDADYLLKSGQGDVDLLENIVLSLCT